MEFFVAIAYIQVYIIICIIWGERLLLGINGAGRQPLADRLSEV